ncbi:MAG TPA: hypothetical protein VGD46_17845 [Rhizobacter sp.]
MNAISTARELAPQGAYAAVHFRECFIDELARAAWRDPVQYRREMLPAGSKLRIVLDEAARVSGLSRPQSAGVAHGVALSAARGAAAAHVAELRVDERGDCWLERMVIVLDGDDDAAAALAREGIAPAVANALAVLRARAAAELGEVAA